MTDEQKIREIYPLIPKIDKPKVVKDEVIHPGYMLVLVEKDQEMVEKDQEMAVWSLCKKTS